MSLLGTATLPETSRQMRERHLRALVRNPGRAEKVRMANGLRDPRHGFSWTMVPMSSSGEEKFDQKGEWVVLCHSVYQQ